MKRTPPFSLASSFNLPSHANYIVATHSSFLSLSWSYILSETRIYVEHFHSAKFTVLWFLSAFLYSPATVSNAVNPKAEIDVVRLEKNRQKEEMEFAV